MDATEKQQMLALLEQGRESLLGALDGVNGEFAVRLPGPGKWSILGCVEHLAISEDYLFAQIDAAIPSETPLISPLREARMLERGTDRSWRIESPEQGHPQGRFPTLPAALEHFLESRRRTIDFVEANHEDLRSRMTWHPILGTANSYEMLLSIGVHCLRHVKQIEEIKAELA
jgi:hypothetical protein